MVSNNKHHIWININKPSQMTNQTRQLMIRNLFTSNL